KHSNGFPLGLMKSPLSELGPRFFDKVCMEVRSRDCAGFASFTLPILPRRGLSRPASTVMTLEPSALRKLASIRAWPACVTPKDLHADVQIRGRNANFDFSVMHHSEQNSPESLI